MIDNTEDMGESNCGLNVGIVIPQRLRSPDLRFIKLHEEDKTPVEKWTTPDHQYCYDSDTLLSHISKGYNYGVMAGPVCVLDVDNPELLENLGVLKHFQGKTFSVKTNKGYHYYFTSGGMEGRQTLYLGSDHLGEVFYSGNFYTVGPNSVHPEGGYYEVVDDLPLIHFSKDELNTIFGPYVKPNNTLLEEAIPERHQFTKNNLSEALGLQIEDFCTPLNGVKQSNGEIQGAHPIHGSKTGKNLSINPRKNVFYCFRDGVGGDPITWIAIQEGYIDCADADRPLDIETFFKVKEWLKENGYRTEINKLDKEYYQSHRKTHRILSNMATPNHPLLSYLRNLYEENGQNVFSQLKNGESKLPENQCECLKSLVALTDELAEKGDYETSERVFLTALYLADRAVPIYRDLIDYDGKAPRLNYDAIALTIIERYAVIAHKNTFFVFNGSHYVYEQGEIRSGIVELIGVSHTAFRAISTAVKEVEIRIHALTQMREYAFQWNGGFIPIKNGVIYTEHNRILLPHSPAWGNAFILPVIYDPTANGEEVRGFLASLVSPADLPLLLQIPAQCLLGKTYKKAYLLQGDHNAGKTTYIEFLQQFLGRENCSALALQEIGDHFRTAELEHKVANIHDDLATVPMKQLGTFKNVTGGGTIVIERKNKDPYSISCSCTFVFSCNSPPFVYTEEEAFWSRWYYIHFPNQFTTDPEFRETLLTENNLSGFLNMVLDGIDRLRVHGLIESDNNDVQRIWRYQNDSVYAFIADSLIITHDGKNSIPKGDMYDAYKKYCTDTDRTAIGEPKFSQYLKRQSGVSDGRVGSRGEQVHVWKGVKWKENTEQ